MATNDKLRLVGAMTGKVLAGPQRIEIEINTVCNLKCMFCWFHSPLSTVKMKTWSLELDKFKGIMDDAKELGVEHIYITGRGEPTMHPDLPAMLKYAKQKGFYVTLTTNLTLLPKSLLTALLLIDKIEVTVGATSTEGYAELQRPQNNHVYTDVMTHLERVIKVAARRKKPVVKVNYIMTRLNIDDAADMVDISEKLGVNEIRLSPFSATPETLSMKPSAIQMRKLKAKLADFKGRRIHIDRIWVDTGTPQLDHCYMGWMTVLIGIYGNVRIGCFDSPLKEDGSIYTKSFKEIWESKLAQENRLKLRDSLHELNFCDACTSKKGLRRTSCPFTIDNVRMENEMQSIRGKSTQ